MPQHVTALQPYFAGKRDLRIDLLRGAAIAAMVIDHVGGDQSWLYALTGGNRFYVSAAEAFVFLAGLVSGIVYGGTAVREGPGQAIVKMLRRAGVLYAWTVGLTLTLPFLAGALGLDWGNPFQDGAPLQVIASVLTLHRTYHFVDVLLLYVLLFGGSGLAIALMSQGKTLLVLGVSWALWLAWQLFPSYAGVPWPIDGMDVFQVAAWQALFITGLAMGFHRRAIADRLRRVPLAAYIGAGAFALALAIALYHHEEQALLAAAPRLDPDTLAGWLFSKSDLRIGRLLTFASVGALAFALVTLAWQWIEAVLGWLLVPLGQHSLTAYVLHIGFVACLIKLGAMAFPDGAGPRQNTLLELAGVFAVWGLIQGSVAVKRLLTSSGVRGALTALQPAAVPAGAAPTLLRDAA